LQRFLTRNRNELIDVSPQTTEDLRQVTDRLLQLRPSPDAGVLWLSRAVPTGDPEFAAWREAWFEATTRLNQFRNLLTRQLPIPLIFVGAEWLLPLLRDAAPDLWSIRATVVRVSPAALASPPAAVLRESGKPRSGPDPELA